MLYRSLATAFFLAIFIGIATARVRIDPATSQWVDESGNVRIYHGFNVVFKDAPYYPETEKWDPLNSFTEEDAQKLHEWGFNVVRLFIAWAAVEPTRGQYDMNYIERVKSIVRMCARYNISIVLDAHQDILARKFCGEGFPEWAFEAPSFPFPFTFDLRRDKDGYPLPEDCMKNSFAYYYFTRDVAKAFQDLYTNARGIRDSFTAFWSLIAREFKSEPNVIAYEHDPLLFAANGRSDRQNIGPFYDAIHSTIREADNDTIILFENFVNNMGDGGLATGPGGPEYNDRQAYSYHIYCSLDGDPKDEEFCTRANKIYFRWRTSLARKMKTGAMLTEFGAVGNTTLGISNLIDVTDRADAYLHSWIYWQYKFLADVTTLAVPRELEGVWNTDGTPLVEKLKALSRPYLFSVCGVPKAFNFDRQALTYTAIYTVSAACAGKGASELYVPEDLHFSGGFDITTSGCNGCTVKPAEAKNYYSIAHGRGVRSGATVTVKVVGKSKHH
eukprot:TRINITY_DN11961_c0_g1_i1.p1 TRINITY_DN11961_c0_g1~~TRINITY_DN11961_c0_g1_i1.p1  ORF type:complete len:500 (+),score=135.78 TRINITY_DN11961_c0_g1_i1:185-1684(+)